MFNVLNKKLAVLSMVFFVAVGCIGADCSNDSSCGCEENLYKMGRGLVNIVTCWVEVPRCLVYYNSQVPVLGLVVGACQGVGFTAIRAFAGVADFVSFGFMSDSIYETCHGFDEWFWEERWLPGKK